MISWTVSSPLIVANSSERVLTPRSVVASSCVRRSLTLSWSSLSRVMASTIWAPLCDSGLAPRPSRPLREPLQASASRRRPRRPRSGALGDDTHHGGLDTDDLLDRAQLRVGED